MYIFPKVINSLLSWRLHIREQEAAMLLAAEVKDKRHYLPSRTALKHDLHLGHKVRIYFAY